MWSLRQRQDKTFYLTFDHDRRFYGGTYGFWDLIGPSDNAITTACVAINRRAGHLCAEDDSGNMRVLVLEANR